MKLLIWIFQGDYRTHPEELLDFSESELSGFKVKRVELLHLVYPDRTVARIQSTFYSHMF